ncbi:hypothetical protein Pst134EA_011865 [Puccinia striiformis f. sp. tritici]|uniref:hypothetical protein n=1 Tax=Puccinia striiformis f. sp. tritici TaxID=168172 RepID=UPI0020085530|nr:hypothetical protein Pst134EA_011865 [Puccinia striiformis f. sp. tritici]KAH9468239.1 hypothetical protein Pst134EA_011865 [Puccinia striiformis f. sp. tritici]
MRNPPGGPTVAEIPKGWQPAPLNSDDWDWIEANLAASRAREAEQAAIFKRDRIEANLASSDTRKAYYIINLYLVFIT